MVKETLNSLIKKFQAALSMLKLVLQKNPLLIWAAALFVLLFFGWMTYSCFSYVNRLSHIITEKFDGKRWQIPAIVYARPLELYSGMLLSQKLLEQELQLGGYRKEKQVTAPGGYSLGQTGFELVTRSFHFPDGFEESKKLTIQFRDNRISELISSESAKQIPFVRLDPARIGSFHPAQHEDRLVLESSEIPELLRRTLMVVEDRDFLSHNGLSLSAIFRAMFANIRAGTTVQGGSTLTQQLVKNFFLNRDRTLSRKMREALMALILERHYSKDEILTAYINEIFIGQDGNRAIHGFGLASQFYFRRDVADLTAAQIATLVGMLKGPSAYDPRRFPEKCLSRRNLVLRLMFDNDLISDKDYNTALAQPLLDTKVQNHGFNRFRAFLDLVRYQLKAEYREEDLQTDGLKILTSLDPQIQWRVEKKLAQTTAKLSKSAGSKQIEGAVIITGRENGEVLALSGGNDPQDRGFNRALDANRSVGSLIKPAVYLTGLVQGFTLASPLLDTIIRIESGGKEWQPKNFDKKEHGRVPFFTALAKSYNLATVRLGMTIGLDNVIRTLKKLGYQKEVQPYPSLLLGGHEMSPLEVTQIYQTIASGGFYQPLRSIQSVMTRKNKLLNRYGLDVEQRFPPKLVYLLTHALERVMTEGSGRSHSLQNSYCAGKTGTSNNQRDSWFAGFTGSYLGVVWLGRDDNKPTSLTGSSGALQVWSNIMKKIDPKSRRSSPPAGIVWTRINRETLKQSRIKSPQTTVLPFLAGTGPEHDSGEAQLKIEEIGQKVQRFLDTLFR